METRGYQFGDVIESIQHGGSLVVSLMSSQSAVGVARKEHLPKEISTIIENAGRALREAGYPKFANDVLKGVFDGGGIRQFIDNFVREISSFSKHSPEQGDEVMKVIGPYLQSIDNALRELNGQVGNRMGNEIMLDAKDFA